MHILTVHPCLKECGGFEGSGLRRRLQWLVRRLHFLLLRLMCKANHSSAILPLTNLVDGHPGREWCRLSSDLAVSHPAVPERDRVVVVIVMDVCVVDAPDFILADA
jgi:hypothetical protein